MEDPMNESLHKRLALAADAFGKGSERELLRFLYVERGLSEAEIGKIFGATRQGVGYALRRWDVSARPPGRRSRLDERACALGFKDLRAYFLARGRQTFGYMARELGVGPGTAQKRYDLFLDEFK